MRTASARLLLLLLLIGAVARADTAVTRDGIVLTGEMLLTDKVLTLGKKEILRDDLYLVEKDDGALVWAPDVAGRLRGYDYLGKQRRGEALAALVKKALSARNASLAREILELAQRDGISGKAVEKAKASIEKLEKRPPDPRPKKTAEVRALLATTRALTADLLAKRATLEADQRMKLILTREALRVSGKCAAALAILEHEAPDDFRLGGKRLWLDWHLDLELAGAFVPPEDTGRVAFARKQWRRDLHEVIAGPIHLITPVKDTKTIGRCLAYGRLACKLLDSLFPTDVPINRKSQSLTVFLFGDKQEYVSLSGTGRAIEDRAFLELTAGYYLPSEGISRFYWSTKPYEERRIAATAVHELTHHWLHKLNPMYDDRQTRARNAATPGYWIVEGFATMIEESRMDIRRSRWDLFNPRSRSLDIVRALTGKRASPWGPAYIMNHLQFAALNATPTILYVRHWSVGQSRISERRLFYERAAATCLYLYHADGGKHRKALLDYVVNHYTGQRAKMTPEAAFGMTGAELAQKAARFAKAVGQGWRPG